MGGGGRRGVAGSGVGEFGRGGGGAAADWLMLLTGKKKRKWFSVKEEAGL